MSDPNEILPTVRVVRNGNECIINETDFNSETDKRVDAAEPTPAPVAVAAEPTGQLGILKKGRKFFVVDTGTSQPVEREGLDASGYASEAEAVQAAQSAM